MEPMDYYGNSFFPPMAGPGSLVPPVPVDVRRERAGEPRAIWPKCVCGVVEGKDLNAALNIKRLGLETLFAGLANWKPLLHGGEPSPSK